VRGGPSAPESPTSAFNPIVGRLVDPAEFYPDTIHFVSYDLDRKSRVTRHAARKGRD